MKRAIDRLRKLIREEQYDISVHANEEMSKNDLIAIDVENVVLSGRITKRFTREARAEHGMKSLAKHVMDDRLGYL